MSVDKPPVMQEIEKFKDEWIKKYNLYSRWNNINTGVALICSVGALVTGFLGAASVAGLLGLLVGITVIVQSTYGLREGAELSHIVVAEAQNEWTKLDSVVKADEEYSEVVAQFMALREKAARASFGKGINAAMDIGKAIGAAKSVDSKN